jgi:hypothetical protein
MPGLITKSARMELARSIYRDILTERDNWFVFASKTIPWEDEPELPKDSWEEISQVHRDMLFVRKVNPAEVVFLAKRINWESGTTYAVYDHADPSLNTKKYYVLTSANRVFKCISNNNGQPSTVEPSIEEEIELESTADGYRWKFLYKILPEDVNQFLTPDYFPVRYYTGISDFNVNGYVKQISVVDTGTGYINPVVIIEGDGTGAAAVASKTDGSISGVTVVKSGSNYSYATARVVDYNIVNGEVVEGPGVGATLALELTTESLDFDPNTPNQLVSSAAMPGAVQAVVIENHGTGYNNTTTIKLTGDGYGAVLTPIVEFGEIRSVHISSEGQDYTFADVEVIGLGEGAVVRPIVSPYRGHGSNIPQELGANVLGIKTPIENEGIFTENDYYQFGLIKNVRNFDTSHFFDSVGNACYIVGVSESDYALFSLDDKITTSGGGEFVVVFKEINDGEFHVWLQDIVPFITETSVLKNETQQINTPIQINKLTEPQLDKRTGDIFFVKSTESQVRDEQENETFQFYLKF